MSKPIVSVVMITYNHEKYIEQSIHGVLMQKCNFEVELIIANDKSTDSTHKVIDKLLKDTCLPNHITIRYYNHHKNKGMINNFYWALEQSKGKYTALCEGDDYWFDPLKLQKQVDFLEFHQDYVLCGTGFHVINNNEVVREISSGDTNSQKSFEQHLMSNQFATLTLCFKTKVLSMINLEALHNYLLGDWPLTLRLLQFGKGIILSDITCAYREHDSGAFSLISSNNQSKTVLLTISKFITQNSINISVERREQLKKELWQVLYQTKDIRERTDILKQVLPAIGSNKLKFQTFMLIANTPHSVFSRLGWRLI
ncbi:glycosyltransferase [Gelidibacter salicanalis]|uniref:Glycosyltransferase n=1 Tax=Gelidibacter salicanalis TaxID=291193 RepID=A0A5C7ALG4_9FLAO|nr:glycosyltransferase [Gelidibacter salicanalis]TXE09271.1 glycosyltransferase [Gelidibacter salicanalis]